MQLSDIPAWFAKRFGADASGSHIRPVPATSVDPNAASMALGFPPNTFVDIGAGGAPPDGRDVNGILNFLSAWAQWQGLGGPTPYDPAVSAAGGYPRGAVVMSASVNGRFFESTTNNNTTNPDTGGAGWVIRVQRAASQSQVEAGTSNELAVTPAGLGSAGYDRVVAQNLVANGGYRRFASGLKECWGSLSIPADSSAIWTPPISHSSWIHPTYAVSTPSDINASQNTGVLSLSTSGITFFTASNQTTTVWVATRGV